MPVPFSNRCKAPEVLGSYAAPKSIVRFGPVYSGLPRNGAVEAKGSGFFTGASRESGGGVEPQRGTTKEADKVKATRERAKINCAVWSGLLRFAAEWCG